MLLTQEKALFLLLWYAVCVHWCNTSIWAKKCQRFAWMIAAQHVFWRVLKLDESRNGGKNKYKAVIKLLHIEAWVDCVKRHIARGFVVQLGGRMVFYVVCCPFLVPSVVPMFCIYVTFCVPLFFFTFFAFCRFMFFVRIVSFLHKFSLFWEGAGCFCLAFFANVLFCCFPTIACYQHISLAESVVRLDLIIDPVSFYWLEEKYDLVLAGFTALPGFTSLSHDMLVYFHAGVPSQVAVYHFLCF